MVAWFGELMMHRPLVSVILPAYNAARYVGTAVGSILAQSFDDFELIVLDDGSSDETLHMVQDLAIRDARIRVVSRANLGLVATLNELVGLARGKFIARMDADDISHPDRLRLQIEYLQSHPECVALGTRALYIDPDGLPIHELVDCFSHEQIEQVLLRPEIGVLHPTVMMRRAEVVRIGGYRSEYRHAEDLDLFLRLGEAGKLANLPQVLLWYRVHLSSVSHANTVEQKQSARRAVRDALDRRQVSAVGPTVADELSAPETIDGLHRKWAWWALSARNIATARKHALRALLRAPSRPGNWLVLACALRGH